MGYRPRHFILHGVPSVLKVIFEHAQIQGLSEPPGTCKQVYLPFPVKKFFYHKRLVCIIIILGNHFFKVIYADWQWLLHTVSSFQAVYEE